ncbi:hypothetical protein PVAP13_1NG291638 [Panicum virgatum]|uniref:Uncharacterized protein n=1 Tax=Panicum virgatum TaxID=38727 RepID=A0A8T0WXY8_PANVG|nr:hypothetical protein PVAP13_1NG291638 [Panicum virgatum]
MLSPSDDWLGALDFSARPSSLLCRPSTTAPPPLWWRHALRPSSTPQRGDALAPPRVYDQTVPRTCDPMTPPADDLTAPPPPPPLRQPALASPHAGPEGTRLLKTRGWEEKEKKRLLVELLPAPAWGKRWEEKEPVLPKGGA